MNNTGLWDKCLQAFCDNLSEKQMKMWIHPLEVSCDSDTLRVIAPNKYIKSKHIVYVFYVYIILTHVDKLAFM